MPLNQIVGRCEGDARFSLCQPSALELVLVSPTASHLHKNACQILPFPTFYITITRHVGTGFRPLTRRAKMNIEGEGIQAKATLNDGRKMPLFGLGVYKAVADCRKAVKFALQNGYRMIDTAALYG